MTRGNEMYFIFQFFRFKKFFLSKMKYTFDSLQSMCPQKQSYYINQLTIMSRNRFCILPVLFLLQLLRFLLACKLTLSRAVTTTASAKGLTDRWITCNRNTLLVFTVFVPLSQNAAGSVFLNSCFSGVCTVI